MLTFLVCLLLIGLEHIFDITANWTNWGLKWSNMRYLNKLGRVSLVQHFLSDTRWRRRSQFISINILKKFSSGFLAQHCHTHLICLLPSWLFFLGMSSRRSDLLVKPTGLGGLLTKRLVHLSFPVQELKQGNGGQWSVFQLLDPPVKWHSARVLE